MLPPNKIKCTKCNKVKSNKEFYKIYSGYTQKRCKDCVSKTNREKTLEIKRKKKAISFF